MSKRPLITCDSHVAIPLHLAEKLPEEYRDKVGHLEERDDGVYFVRPEPLIRQDGADPDVLAKNNNMMTNMLAAGIKVDPDDSDMIARLEYGLVTPEATPGFTVENRLEQMEQDGTVGQVLFGPGSFGSVKDPAVDVLWAQIQNDWLAETYGGENLDKFAIGINLPLNAGPEACAAELERKGAALGMRPGLLPDAIVDKPYNLPMWDPLWEAANRLKIPIALHQTGVRGFSMPWRRLREPTEWGPGEALTGMAILCAGNAEGVSWFVASGILERYPDLTIVITESQAGWLGWLMQWLDHLWGARFSRADRGLKMMMGDFFNLTEELPSYYMKRQVRAQFSWDKSAIAQRHLTGIECLVWGNDYPHPEGVWPDSQAVIDQQFEGVPEDEIRRIVHDNAAEIYSLTV